MLFNVFTMLLNALEKCYKMTEKLLSETKMHYKINRNQSLLKLRWHTRVNKPSWGCLLNRMLFNGFQSLINICHCSSMLFSVFSSNLNFLERSGINGYSQSHKYRILTDVLKFNSFSNFLKMTRVFQ